MSQTDEERNEKTKEMVNAMRNAQKNMSAALARIETLERALRDAATRFGNCKKWVPEHAYMYDCKTSIMDKIDEYQADALKHL